MACDIWETQVTCLRSSFVYSVDRPWPWILPSFCGWTQIQWLGGCWIWRSVVNSSSCPESGARRFISELELEPSTREPWCFPLGCCKAAVTMALTWCGELQHLLLGAVVRRRQQPWHLVPWVVAVSLLWPTATSSAPAPCGSSPLPYSEWPRASWPTGLPSLTLPVT